MSLSRVLVLVLVSISLLFKSGSPDDNLKTPDQGCGCPYSRSGRSTEPSAASELNYVDDEAKVEWKSDTVPDGRGLERTNKMILVEGSTFTMGTDKPLIVADGEGPAREVTVDTFWMDVHEVSNAEFKLFVDATGYVTEVCLVISQLSVNDRSE